MATRKDLTSIFFSKKNFYSFLRKVTKLQEKIFRRLEFYAKSQRGEGIHPTLVLMGLTFVRPRIIQNGSCLPPSHTS